ncbi:MAG TPA: bifunctional diguanylate cyclase/phosphodiesterase [Xanthobacteraceae bacterium]|nr:bifunctional diguanylate cyclase/phosphodiesterase [Xanthobacteraceae bacterium]
MTVLPVRPEPRLIAPFALVMLAMFALCAAFGYLLARQADDRHQDQQRASLLGVVDEFRNVFGDMTRQAAADLAAHTLADRPALAGALDPAGLTRYRHQRARVVGADGAPIAAFPAADPTPPAVARIIADYRASHAGAAGARPPVMTALVALDGYPTLVAVASVRPSGSPPASNAAPVLVRETRLDAGLIAAFERMSGVSGLAFDADTPRRDRDVASLLDAQGRMVGWLSWTRETPSLDAVMRLAPFIGAIGVCLVGFALLAIRQIGRTTQRLATSEAQARRIAYEDAVTGLPNRACTLDLLDAALAARAANGIVAFALVAIDRFSELKHSLGEAGTERLLAAGAARLRGALPAAVTLGRVGPAEFAIIVAGTDGAAAAQAAATAMAPALAIANQSVHAAVKIGLVQAPRDGSEREELMRRADLARRAAEPGAPVARFEPAMERDFQYRLLIKRDLRRTLAEEGFEVHYQPIVGAEGQRIVGVEALLRWNHPTRGMIPPTEFIPVAEQSGLMVQLGEFVLRRALRDAKPWRGLFIAVNLSPFQMRDRGLVDLVAAVLAETGIAPSRVVLEVTEGVLIDDPDDAMARLQELRALGVRIALDDFGSGYSSLSYLRRFPIDKLKIDKEFVAPLGRSSDGGVIIQAIMALGHALGLTVLCEGVETEEQRILLRLAGCDEMQGFLFAKPAPRAAIDRLLAAQGGEAPRRALA